MAAPPETFTLLPLHIDPTSKSISSPLPDLTNPLTTLNALHKTLLAHPTATPPPPLPTPPQRSAQITKLRDSANLILRKPNQPAAQIQEAIRLYTYALSMALSRPGYEPAALVREEAATLFANRAQAWMMVQGWAEGWGDAKQSVECKRQGNGKGWWRGGRCLVEMGRWGEAGQWVAEGLGEVDGDGKGELEALGKEVEGRLKEREERR